MIVKFVEMLILYFFCNFILYVANILPFAVPEVELTNFIESLIIMTSSICCLNISSNCNEYILNQREV